jgi:CDP-diglyceride synthetase
MPTPAESDSAVLTPVFVFSRRFHRIASGLLAAIALAHSGLTFVFYSGWSPNAVWFLGTGLGLLLLALLNWTHVGIEPCRLPTARLVRPANWVFVLFGIGAVVAVPEPQAFAVLAGLVGQAVVARWTLPGPGAR